MALRDQTPKRIVGPVAMSAANSTLGSAVAAGKRQIIKQVVIVNTGTSQRTVQVAIGTSATGANRFIDLPLAGRETLVFNTSLPLEVGEQLNANQGTGTDCTITVSAVEQTL